MLDILYLTEKAKEEYYHQKEALKAKQSMNRSGGVEEEPTAAENSGGIIIFVIWFACMAIIMTGIYGNMKFVFTCKKGSVMHFLLATIFWLFYIPYRWFTKCNT